MDDGVSVEHSSFALMSMSPHRRFNYEKCRSCDTADGGTQNNNLAKCDKRGNNASPSASI